MVKVFIFLLLVTIINFSVSGQGKISGDTTNEWATTFIFGYYLKERLAESRNDFYVQQKRMKFTLSEFAGIANSTQKQALPSAIDSLLLLSDNLNSQCKGSGNGTSPRSKEKAKYVVFFTENCSGLLQAHIYFRNDNLTIEQYLNNYYGEYVSVLFEISSETPTIKYHYTLIHSN